MSVLTHTPTPASVFDEEVEERRDDVGRDYTGWWCIATDPWSCPVDGCPFVGRHLTAAHLIVIWPTRDDRMLLTYANDAHQFGRNPRVVEYEKAHGPCIPYDMWVKIGQPVHGRIDRPADKPFRRL